MMFIRPIALSDLDQLEALAVEAGVGMTTLPSNRDSLQKKIEWSLESFSRQDDQPENEYYLFVLEDSSSQQVVGTCGVMSTTGRSQPFYSYKVGTLVHFSAALKVNKEIKTLSLTNDLTGLSEICTLFLNQSYRKGGCGRLLSRIRFLFMADFPKRFYDTVIAEMRGVQDEEGRSPLWKNLGNHFFDMDFSKADYLSAIGNKQFISDLMPKYPIYINLLPREAQEVIGVVHDNTKPAAKLLNREEFGFKGYVDIFDGGPTLMATRKDIYTVKNSRVAEVSNIVDRIDSDTYLLGNRRIDFRGCLGAVQTNDDGSINITRETADLLDVGAGDKIRYIAFYNYS